MNLQRIILSVLVSVFFIQPVFAASAATVHILCYHAFLDRKDGISFSYRELKKQLLTLKKKGYTFVSYKDVVEKKIRGSMNILVSVDDGNKSVLKAYNEVFKPMGIKPLLAIYPNIIGKMHYALTWNQLRYLASEGCEIAAHGYFHLYVTKKLYKKNRRYFMYEIYRSKRVLEQKLGRKIHTFVYPFGVRSPITITHLKKAGYKYALTIDSRSFALPRSHVSGLYEIPRYYMTQKGWKTAFAQIYRRSSSTAIASSTLKDIYTGDGSTGSSSYYLSKQHKSRAVRTEVMAASVKGKKKDKTKQKDASSMLDPPERSRRFIKLKSKYKEMQKENQQYYTLWLLIINKRLKELTKKAADALPAKKKSSSDQ